MQNLESKRNLDQAKTQQLVTVTELGVGPDEAREVGSGNEFGLYADRNAKSQHILDSRVMS